MSDQTTTSDAPKTSFLTKIKGLSQKAKLIIAAGVVVLLGGGTAFAYAAIQSPENTVGLAIASAFTGSHPSGNLDIKAEGAALSGDASLDIFNSDTGVALKLKVAATLAGQPVGATLNVVSAKSGDLYLNLDEYSTLASYLQNSGMVPSAAVAAYETVLNGVWIKVTKTDIDQLTGGGNGSGCLSGKLDDSAYTKALSGELQTALRGNLFIVPTKELPGVNGDRVFTLGISAEKLKGFLKAVRGTKYYADLQTCVPGFEITDAQINDITQAKIDEAAKQSGIVVTLYAKGGWSPKMDKLVIEGGSAMTEKITATYTPGGDQSNKVVIPTQSKTVQELMNSLLTAPY
mgnify:CR=1 FL=1